MTKRLYNVLLLLYKYKHKGNTSQGQPSAGPFKQKLVEKILEYSLQNIYGKSRLPIRFQIVKRNHRCSHQIIHWKFSKF